MRTAWTGYGVYRAGGWRLGKIVVVAVPADDEQRSRLGTPLGAWPRRFVDSIISDNGLAGLPAGHSSHEIGSSSGSLR